MARFIKYEVNGETVNGNHVQLTLSQNPEGWKTDGIRPNCEEGKR